MLKFKCPIIFFSLRHPFLTMITGATPLSSSRLWISTTASLATPPSSDCTKTVIRGCQYQASRIWLTCVWYCNIGNMLIVYCKSDTFPTCPNLSPTCPNKFFMSEQFKESKEIRKGRGSPMYDTFLWFIYHNQIDLHIAYKSSFSAFLCRYSCIYCSSSDTFPNALWQTERSL